MTITFPCKVCGKQYRAQAEQAGKQIKCATCGTAIRIPVPRNLSAAPSAPATEEVACPSCHMKCAILPEWRGKTLECPTCHRQFVVPGAAAMGARDSVDDSEFSSALPHSSERRHQGAWKNLSEGEPAAEPISRRTSSKRTSLQIDMARWGVFGALGVLAVVVVVGVVMLGSKMIQAVSSQVSGRVGNLSQPAEYFPNDWNMAMHVRVAELLDGRLDKTPALKNAFGQVIEQSRQVGLDLNQMDDLFLTGDLQNNLASVAILFNKPVTLNPGSEEFYRGEKIIRRSNTEYQIRPHSRLVVVASRSDRLRQLIDQAARGESHPIEFPAGCQLSIRVRNMESLGDVSPWSTAGGAGPGGMKGFVLGMNVADRVEIQWIADATDGEAARRIDQEIQEQIRSTREFFEASKGIGSAGPTQSILVALDAVTCVTVGNQVRMTMTMEPDAINTLAGQGAAGGGFAGLASVRFDPPPKPVLVTMTGVKDNDAEQRILTNLRSLTDTPPGSYQLQSNRVAGKSVVQIGPVNDPANLARRIEFGKVTVEGRRLSVEVDGARVAQLPMPASVHQAAATGRPRQTGPRDVKTILEDLNTNNVAIRRDALKALATMTPDDDRQVVARKLEGILESGDRLLADDAFDALVVWGDSQSVPAVKTILRSAMHSSSHSQALAFLARYPNEDSVAAVIDFLSDVQPPGLVLPTLEKMGAAGEPAAVAILGRSGGWIFAKRDVARFLESFSKKNRLADESVTVLLDTVRNETDTETVKPLISALANVREERVADVLATGLDDFRFARESRVALIAMGPVAEKSVAKYLKHQNPQIRIACCEILAAIGTRRSISALRPLTGNNPVSQSAKNAIDAINQRANQQGE